MKLFSWIVAGVFGFVVLGCGSASRAPAAYGGAEPATANAKSTWSGAAETESAAEYDAEPSSAAPGYGPSTASQPAPSPAAEATKRRPGLGTTWGEDRSSYVTTTTFFRMNPDRPFATSTIYYNDAAGVHAMAAQSGRSDYYDNTYPVTSGQLEVVLLDPSMRPLPCTTAGGRAYVVGEAGERYVLRVQNHTGNRVEVVATVDGLDVIDGRPGSFRNRGYILNPWATLDIEGFRRSDSAVATFRFGSVEESYAERKGKGRNVGVIGVAFFDESGSRWPWTDEAIRQRHDADPFPGRYAEPPPTW
ncbi:MAG: hypothetical protein JW751_08330 [Polyangiaceae bacterium]|nr:hypothetical protein [Polyangiaceae bacterium]